MVHVVSMPSATGPSSSITSHIRICVFHNLRILECRDLESNAPDIRLRQFRFSDLLEFKRQLLKMLGNIGDYSAVAEQL
jgi:hypothetical protein